MLSFKEKFSLTVSTLPIVVQLPGPSPRVKKEVKTEVGAGLNHQPISTPQLDARHIQAYWQYVNSPNEGTNMDLLSNDTKTLPQTVSLLVSQDIVHRSICCTFNRPKTCTRGCL